MQNCKGVFGWLFGHKMDHVIEQELGEPKFIPDGRVVPKYDESLSSVLRGLTEMLEASKSCKEHYVHSVCLRCGMVSDRLETKPQSALAKTILSDSRPLISEVFKPAETKAAATEVSKPAESTLPTTTA